MTIKDPKNTIRGVIIKLGGPPLSDSQIRLIHKNIEPRIILAEEGKLLEIWIPLPYWTGNLSRLTSLVTHEYANLHFAHPTKAELAMLRALKKIKFDKTGSPQKNRRYQAVLAEYETKHGVIIDQLTRKLSVDALAIKLLRKHKLPLDGYLAFLETELARAQKLPAPRWIWHTLALCLRIDEAQKQLASSHYHPRFLIGLLEERKSSR